MHTIIVVFSDFKNKGGQWLVLERRINASVRTLRGALSLKRNDLHRDRHR